MHNFRKRDVISSIYMEYMLLHMQYHACNVVSILGNCLPQTKCTSDFFYVPNPCILGTKMNVTWVLNN